MARPAYKDWAGEIKSKSNLTKAKYWNFKKLKQFKEIHEMLAAGEDALTVARHMQKNLKVYTHMTEKSLHNFLLSYRKTIPKHELFKGPNEQFLNNAKEAVRKQIEVLEEYAKLYDLQMKRIERGIDQENTIGMNLTTVETAIKTASGLLESIHTVQSDLGITPKHLGTMNMEANVLQGIVHKFADNNVSKVLEDPTSRYKVLNVAERILALAATQKQNHNTILKSNALPDLLTNDNRITIDAEDLINVDQNNEKTLR